MRIAITLEVLKDRIIKQHKDKIRIVDSSYKGFCKSAIFIHKIYGEFSAIPKNILKHKRLKQDSIKNLIGQKFGMLQVIKFSHTNKENAFWVCICDCGNEKEKIVDTHSLTRGATTTCGCRGKENLANKRFGSLLVIDSFLKNGVTFWNYVCDCTNKGCARTGDFKIIKSCGCSHHKNLLGKKFGKLRPIKFCKEAKVSSWLCKCECGNKEVIVRTRSLVSGHSRSCGCSKLEFQQKTSIKKYGFANPMQNPVIALSAAKSQSKSYLLYHWKTGQEIICQSGWEALVVEYLNNNRIDFSWQSKSFIMPDGKTYRPDLYLKKQRKWVEIKGYFRGNAEEKWNWFHKEYPNSELWNKDMLIKMGILKNKNTKFIPKH